MPTITRSTAALALAATLAAALAAPLAGCGGTPDAFLSVSGRRSTTLDNVRPTIVGTLPGRNAIDVSTRSSIMVTFSEPVDSSTALTIELSTGTPGQLYLAGSSAQFVPSSPL